MSMFGFGGDDDQQQQQDAPVAPAGAREKIEVSEDLFSISEKTGGFIRSENFGRGNLCSWTAGIIG